MHANLQVISINDSEKKSNKEKDLNRIESLKTRVEQIKLNNYYQRLLFAPEDFQKAPDDVQELAEIRAIEDSWNILEEERIKNIYLPNKHDFIDWYQDVNQKHKNDVRPFFNYLANEASLNEIAYYICLEEKVDGSFDDIISLAQLGMKGSMKLVLAENYWDEMGHGNEREMHTNLFAKSTCYMKNLIKDFPELHNEIPVASMKNGNVLMMFALRRKYIPRLIGAISILEDTASERFSATVKGLNKYSLPYEVVEYHVAHIEIDSNHGIQLFNRVLLPLVNTGNLSLIHEIARGILIRFNIAVDYYNAIQDKVYDFRESIKTRGVD